MSATLSEADLPFLDRASTNISLTLHLKIVTINQSLAQL
jgi:hypothetical protein